MYSLFIDTTAGLTIGLLDESFSWKSFDISADNKPSETIHTKIFNLLNQYQLQLKDIRLFYIAGPGSYTGMRLSEGLADIVKWNEIETFSFYHFDIPKYLGIKKGQWITNAFKKEIFSYTWDENIESKELLAECLNEEAFTLQKTQEFIKQMPVEIFSKVVLLNEKKETYYFRTLEAEFG